MNRYGLSLGLAIFVLLAGCSKEKYRFTDEQLKNMPTAQRTGLPVPTGGTVLAVGGQTITEDEIANLLVTRFIDMAKSNDYERFKTIARPQVEQYLVSRISNILIYNEAKKDAGDNMDDAVEKIVESELRKFIVSNNNDYAKAEESLREMNMDWVSYKEYLKKMILTQSYLHQKMTDERPVTYGEIVEYYNKTKDKYYSKPASLQFQLIDIDYKKVVRKDANESAEAAAKGLAAEIFGKITSGYDFGELAKQYSNDYKASAGGLWKPVQPESLEKPYDVLVKEAEKINAGQVASPIETQGHIFIMKLVDKKAATCEPLEKVQKEIEDKIEFERKKNNIDKINLKFVQNASISAYEPFLERCITRIYEQANF